MVENPETPFCAILGWPFSGDVLNNTPDIFSEMEQNSFPQTDRAKNGRNLGGGCFAGFLVGHFRGCFEY
jgi:hypothetical protein